MKTMKMSARRRTLCAIATVGSMSAFCSSNAHAADPEKVTAQALFEEGRDLVKAGKFAQACPKLAQSLKLDPGIGTMLWLADCYENAGQIASAWAQFKDAAAAASLAHDPREKVARRRVDGLEGRLTKMVIRVGSDARVAGLEVRRDGAPVSDVEYGMAIPLDPGRHTVAATATGRTPWTVEVEVPARPESVVVEVPTLAMKPVAASGSTPSKDEPREALPVNASSSSTSPLRIVGLSTAGAGVVALGAGVFLGLGAKSKYDASNANGHCTSANVCDNEGKENRSSASSLATGATIAFGAGALAVIGGVVMYLVAPSSSAQSSVGLTPVVGPRQAGLSFQRTF